MTYCNKCDHCQKMNPCGCAEPVFSIEAMPDDPTVLRFNVNGKSVWYDFSPVVKSAETCTALNVDAIARTLNYIGECSENSITAQELGSILHLADIGDVNKNTIKANGILNYRVSTNCPEGCEGTSNEWVSTNPVEVGGNSLEYILGSDSEGSLESLMPPANSNKFQYLAWAAGNKVKWVSPSEIASASDNYAPLYIDKTTGEIVMLRGN